MRKNRLWAKAWHMVIIWSLLVPSQALLGVGGLLGLGGDKGLLGTGIGGEKGLLGTGLLGSGGGSSGSGGGSSDTGLLGTGIGGDKGLLGTGLLASGGESSGAATNKSDDSGKGGLLTGLLGGGGGGLLGGGGGGDGGLLGGLLGNGSLLGGGAESGGGGLLGGVLGEKGLLGDKGLLGGQLLGKDGLLNLGGEKGLLGGLLGGDKGLLGGLLGDKGLLGGLLSGDLLGGLLGSGQSKEPFTWFNALNLEIVRGSWKIIHGTELVLNLQARVTANFPGFLRFLSGSSAEMNITADLALTQNRPGDLQLELKNCKDLVGGFSVNLPKGLIGMLMNGVINTALRTILPTLMCPVFQIWFSIINMQLRFFNDFIFFGLLGQIHSALSSVPFSTGQFSELDFKDKPFPGAFLQWFLNLLTGGRKSS